MTEPPPARAPRWLRLAALVAVLLLAGAGAWNHELWIYDEPREAELARTMWRTGNWTFTVLNEQPFLEKPPLFSESVAAAFALLGRPSIVAARLVAAAWSLVTLAVVYWFARRAVFAREAGALLAALVLATTNRFYVCQHTLLLDNALCAFTTAALCFGWCARRERRLAFALVAGAALAGAFLVKGVVGVGIVGLVLGLEIVLARDTAGAKTLLHPAVLVVAAAPPLLYAWLLERAGGPAAGHELFWNNQVGRFFHAYNSVRTSWHLYLRTWPELLVPWTPLALLALVFPPRRETTRFLALWAVAPLVALSFSQARSRFYAVPVVPGSALLVASYLETLEPPRWARVLAGWIWYASGLGVVAAAVVFASCGPRDALLVLAGLAGLGGLAGLAWVRREKTVSAETAALAFMPVVVGGWLLYSSSFVAAIREPHLSYKPLADEAWAHAGSRRLVLFHANDSYSGTFAFYADRSVPGFDEQLDADGSKLIAAITTSDLVLAPRGAYDNLDAAKKRDLVIEWEGPALAERRASFVLFGKRAAP